MKKTLIFGCLLLVAFAQIPKMNPNCTVIKSPNLYLENEIYLSRASEYIAGFNLSYSIQSVNNSNSVSVSNPSTPLSVASNNLKTILSTDSILDYQSNYAYYGLLELRPEVGYYFYFVESKNATEAPAFTTPVFDVALAENIVCFTATVIDRKSMIVSCFNNGTTRTNIFYVGNAAGFTKLEFNDWDTNWSSIKGRKIVKFNYYQGSGVTGTFLAMISAQLDISFVKGAPTTNYVYIYRYGTGTDLGLQSRVGSADYKANAPNFQIFDIASSADQIFLLDMNNLFRFNYDTIAKKGVNWSANELLMSSKHMAVYQDGKTTSVMLIHDLSINEIVVETDNNRILKNVTYQVDFPIANTQSVYITPMFLAIALPHYIVVYERNGQRGVNKQIFGMFGYDNMDPDYTFRLLSNDYAIQIGPRLSHLFYLNPSFINGTTLQANDLWTLTATSTALNLTKVCSTNITVEYITNDIKSWHVYTTNVTQTNDYGNRGIILAEDQRFIFNLGQSFVGWNISYDVMKTSMGTDENLISVLQPYQIQGILNGAGAPNSRNVLFQRSYAIDKNEFALITQDENQNLYFQRCQVVPDLYNCTLIGKQPLQTDILDVSMGQIVGGSIWIVGVLQVGVDNSHFIQFNDMSKTFVVEQGAQANSIQLVGNYAFFTSSQLQYVKIFELSSNSATLRSTLTTDTATNWNGNSTNWMPYKIHAEERFPNRIVIQTLTAVYTVGFSLNDLQVYFMNLMKLNGVRGDDENYSRSVQYFGNYIVIIEGANENIVVNEFSLVNPYKPTLTHSVKVQQDLTPLFPIVASYAINSRLFYALMTNQKNGEVFLYAMRYGVTSIESVYKTFKLQSTSTASSNYKLSVSSSFGEDWVVLADQAQNITYGFTVFEQDMVVLNTVGRNDNFNPSSENYVDLYTYDIWAQGGYEYSERHVTALIGVINSQTQIAPIAGVNATKAVYDGQNGSSFQFCPDNYLAGTVLTYSILNNSAINFTVTQKLHQKAEFNISTDPTSSVTNKNLQDIQAFPDDPNNLVYMLLNNGSIIEVDSAKGTQQALSGFTSTGLFCNYLYLSVINGNQYAYSMCFDTENQYNLVLFNVTSGSFVHAYILQNVLEYTSVQLVTEQSVLIVDSLMDANFVGRAYLFNLLQGNAILANTFKSGYCGLPSNFNIVFGQSFVYQNTAAIIFLDGFGAGLGVVSVSLNDFSCRPDSTIVNVGQKLYNQRGYIPTNANYERFGFVRHSSIGGNPANTTHTILLKIVDAPVYQFTFHLLFDNIAHSVAAWMGSLSAIYNNYQPYNSILNTFSLAPDFSAFAVTYLKPSDGRAATYVVAVYDLVNTDPNYSSSTSAIVPLETISAAYITNPAQFQGFPYNSWSSKVGNLWIWNDANSILEQHVYSQNITITSINQIQEDFVLIIQGKSDYDAASYAQPISIKSGNNSDEKNLTWLWITLGIAAGVGIGLGIYFFFKKRNILELEHKLTDEETA